MNTLLMNAHCADVLDELNVVACIDSIYCILPQRAHLSRADHQRFVDCLQIWREGEFKIITSKWKTDFYSANSLQTNRRC